MSRTGPAGGSGFPGFSRPCVQQLQQDRERAHDHTCNHHHANDDAENTIVALAVLSKHSKHIKNILTRMNDYRKSHTNHDIARFFAGVLVVMILFTLSTMAVRSAYGMYQTFRVAATEAESAAVELAALEQQHVQVQETLASLGTARGVEAAVRERFGVARPGEGEIRIVRDQGAEESSEGVGEGNMFSRFFQSLFVW